VLLWVSSCRLRPLSSSAHVMTRPGDMACPFCRPARFLQSPRWEQQQQQQQHIGLPCSASLVQNSKADCSSAQACRASLCLPRAARPAARWLLLTLSSGIPETGRTMAATEPLLRDSLAVRSSWGTLRCCGERAPGRRPSWVQAIQQ